jgi:hypothetical protein
MTLIHEKYTEPAREVERVARMKCDLCGAESRNEREWPHRKEASRYHYSTTTVQFTEGFIYPDDWASESTEYHICPTCFIQKLIPWLSAQGAEPTKSDSM